MTDVYKTIKSSSKGLFKARGSKFMSFAYPIKSVDEVKEILKSLKKEYHDARHHCFAYILGVEKDIYRINDDGEPSGSAGNPIYNQLLSYDLTNILVVVVRYFGGVKLGIPGLINAYKSACIDSIGNADIVSKQLKSIFQINYKYEQMNDVMKIIKEEKLEQIEVNFNLDCSVKFAIKVSLAKDIENKLSKISNLKLSYLYDE